MINNYCRSLFGEIKPVVYKIIIMAAVSFSVCLGENPFIHSIYTADPSARVRDDGRIYVYASHDVDPNQGCDLMDRYHVFSSSDMVNWVDEGEILSSDDVEWGRPEGGFMWAPDCAYKNGTYYYYFPHPGETDWGSSWKIGVATSDKPASGFVCQGYIEGLDPLIDPCVFIDDDGQAYFYHGGGGVCKGGRLTDNMMEIDGQMQEMEGLVDFHEAAWVHKYNGVYYLSYADNHSDETGDNRMCYATSGNPLGPWTYQGIIMDPTDSFCAHGSIVQFNGNWYVFYHNSAISGNDWLRSICVDRLYYNEDGSIQKVVQTTEGVAAAGEESDPLPVIGIYEAEKSTLGGDAALIDGAQASGGQASGGQAVQSLHTEGSYIRFDNVDGGDGGRAALHIYYACEETSKVRLTVNETDYSFVNTLATGGWSEYTGHSQLTVELQDGETNTILFTGGHGGVNIDYMEVTSFDEPVSAKKQLIQKTSVHGEINTLIKKDGVMISWFIPGFDGSIKKAILRIYDMSGRNVWEKKIRRPELGSSGKVLIEGNNEFTSGIYIVRMSYVAENNTQQEVLTGGIQVLR